MLECHEMDIMALRHMNHLSRQEIVVSNHALTLISGLQEYGWSVFCVDVRNTYGLPFDVTFSFGEDGVNALHSSQA